MQTEENVKLIQAKEEGVKFNWETFFSAFYYEVKTKKDMKTMLTKATVGEY